MQLPQVMLDAAPEAIYLSRLDNSARLVQILSSTTLFFGKCYAANLFPSQFANSFISDLLDSHANRQRRVVTYIIAELT